MRRILPYILILIVLIGTFGPAIMVSAADPLGTCTLRDKTYNTLAQLPNETENNCHRMADDLANNSTFVRWIQNSVTPPVPPPTPPPTPTPPPANTTYNFLSPLPCTDSTPGCVGGKLETFDSTGDGGGALGGYLNLMLKLFIGICAVLAVVMIVMGGIQYMTSELISSKAEGKKRILNAIFGLLLALGAYTLLYTINPDLLDTKLSSLKNVEVEVNLAEDNIQATATNPACVEADMVSITLFGKSGVKINKKVVTTLRNIEAVWTAKGGNSYYQINTVFGYVCRPVTNKPGFWSAHAFGLALDINQGTNPYGKTLVTDMEPSKFYQLFTSASWGWGGAWTSIKDAMHFSSNNQ